MFVDALIFWALKEFSSFSECDKLHGSQSPDPNKLRITYWFYYLVNIHFCVCNSVTAKKLRTVEMNSNIFPGKTIEGSCPICSLWSQHIVGSTWTKSSRTAVPLGCCWGWKSWPLWLHQAAHHAYVSACCLALLELWAASFIHIDFQLWTENIQ
jgi:hypothetical protein